MSVILIGLLGTKTPTSRVVCAADVDLFKLLSVKTAVSTPPLTSAFAESENPSSGSPKSFKDSMKDFAGPVVVALLVGLNAEELTPFEY